MQDIPGLAKLQKVLLDLLAIQETFRNHRKIIGSLQDNPGLVKLQERYLGPSDYPGDF